MKFAGIAAAIALIGTAAQAENQQTADLGGGVDVVLAGDWSVKQTTNPAMAMPAMRAMIHGASETRLRKGETGVLVSYMHFKSDKPEPPMDAAAMAAADDLTRKLGAQYLPVAAEKQVEPRSQMVGPLIVSLATLTAREGEQFNVAPGYPGGCVTTGSIRRGTAAWAISVASERCDAATHTEMVEALFAARAD